MKKQIKSNEIHDKIVDSIVTGWDSHAVINFQDNTYLVITAVAGYDGDTEIELDEICSVVELGINDNDLVNAGIISQKEIDDIRQKRGEMLEKRVKEKELRQLEYLKRKYGQ